MEKEITAAIQPSYKLKEGLVSALRIIFLILVVIAALIFSVVRVVNIITIIIGIIIVFGSKSIKLQATGWFLIILATLITVFWHLFYTVPEVLPI